MQIIVFELPHVFSGDSNPLENAKALRVLLDALIGLNTAYLEHHNVPLLYRAGVRYARTVEWDPIPALYLRRFGDCKSLAAARIAELRKQGIACTPDFRWMKTPQRDGNLYHILVRRHPCPEAPGGVEDPSKILGMGQNEWSHF